MAADTVPNLDELCQVSRELDYIHAKLKAIRHLWHDLPSQGHLESYARHLAVIAESLEQADRYWRATTVTPGQRNDWSLPSCASAD